MYIGILEVCKLRPLVILKKKISNKLISINIFKGNYKYLVLARCTFFEKKILMQLYKKAETYWFLTSSRYSAVSINKTYLKKLGLYYM